MTAVTNYQLINSIKAKYSIEDWEPFDNHPNLFGTTTRALLELYKNEDNNSKVHEDILRSIIFYRRMAGSQINFAGGDETFILVGDKIDSLLLYSNNDICMSFFALQYLEAETMRIGLEQYPPYKQIIADIILVNVLEFNLNKGINLAQNEYYLCVEKFESNWYKLNIK